MLKLVKNCFDMISCLMDHLYYLARVGVYKWTNKQEDYLVTAVAAFCTLTSLSLDILNEFTIAYAKKQ